MDANTEECLERALTHVIEAAEQQSGLSLEQLVMREAEKRVPFGSALFNRNFPWCFKKLRDDRWLMLDRCSNFLGGDSAIGDPAKCAARSVRFKCAPEKIPYVWHRVSPTTLWLYDDDAGSHHRYFPRLAVVFNKLDTTAIGRIVAAEMLLRDLAAIDRVLLKGVAAHGTRAH